MTALEKLVARITKAGGDGLANPDLECGCGLGDLAPCVEGLQPECRIAKSEIVQEGDDYDNYMLAPGDRVWVELPGGKSR